MNFKNVALESIAYALPPEVLSSDALEEKLAPLYKRLKLPFGRLELMTGIQERRLWPRSLPPSQASTEAGKKVLSKSQFKKENIDLLIHAAVCRDRLEPATAAYVHHLLGLQSHTQLFDVSNACLGFLNAIVIAGNMIDNGQIKTALIVSGENGRPLIDNTLDHLLNTDLSRNEIKPFFANLTIGSGAAAMILSHSSLVDPQSPKILSACTESDTSASNLCEGNATTDQALEMQTDSEKLLEVGIALAKRCWDKFENHTGWNKDTPECIICHQVGKRHLTQLYQFLDLNIDKDYSTFNLLGNVGSASLPITLAKALENGAILPDDPVALLGIGSGLSSMMIAMQW